MIFSSHHIGAPVSEDRPRIRVAGTVVTEARLGANARRLAAALEERLPSASAVALYVDPTPEFCYALIALALSGKTCVPFDFVRHHDNVADVIAAGLPILMPATPRLRWDLSPIYSVNELLQTAPGPQSDSSAPVARAPLFVTRLGLVRLEFGRGYLRRFFQTMDAWGRVERMFCALAPLDFIGILEILWMLEAGGEILLPAGIPPGSGAELTRHLRDGKVDCVQCDAFQVATIRRSFPELICLVQSGNEDVESERFHRLMHAPE